jgi:hypothetical protein
LGEYTAREDAGKYSLECRLEVRWAREDVEKRFT